MSGSPLIPNELVQESAEKLVKDLEAQFGKPIHGIVISALVEQQDENGRIMVAPANLGRWRAGVQQRKIFHTWALSVADYLTERLEKQQ